MAISQHLSPWEREISQTSLLQGISKTQRKGIPPPACSHPTSLMSIFIATLCVNPWLLFCQTGYI